jgi:hypothetical protein
MPVAQGTPPDLPGYCAPTVTLMRVGYTSSRSVHVSDFALFRLLIPRCRLVSASYSSRQRFASGFLRIPSHPGHPCRAANTSPCRVCRGLPPPSECALPGARKRGARCRAPLRVASRKGLRNRSASVPDSPKAPCLPSSRGRSWSRVSGSTSASVAAAACRP